nr:putative serine/threonine-protein kinase/receptor [Megavirus caiporensis]
MNIIIIGRNNIECFHCFFLKNSQTCVLGHDNTKCETCGSANIFGKCPLLSWHTDINYGSDINQLIAQIISKIIAMSPKFGGKNICINPLKIREQFKKEFVNKSTREFIKGAIIIASILKNYDNNQFI